MESISRRGFLAMGAAGAAHLLRPAAALPSRNTSPGKRRLLFNWDGSTIHCWGRTALPHSEGPLTRDQFTSLVFTPIEDSAVDTVLFSFGSGNVAEYQSRVLEWPGEADNFQFPEGRTWHARHPGGPQGSVPEPEVAGGRRTQSPGGCGPGMPPPRPGGLCFSAHERLPRCPSGARAVAEPGTAHLQTPQSRLAFQSALVDGAQFRKTPGPRSQAASDRGIFRSLGFRRHRVGLASPHLELSPGHGT